MIEFDIYFFKSKTNIGTDDWRIQSQADDKDERADFSKEFDKQVKKLQNTKPEEYDDTYIKVLKKLSTFFNFPEFALKQIGVVKNFSTFEYIYNVKTIDELINAKERIVNNMHQKFEADFENVDFVYYLLAPHFHENACWVSKDVINEAIEKCNKAIEDKHHPEDYLPTENDVYDKEYYSMVRQCRKAFKKLLKLMDKKYLLYAIYIPNVKLGEKTGENLGVSE